MLNRGSDERGVTLVEMLIASLIVAVTLSAAAGWLVSASHAMATNTSRSADNAAAQAVVARIDSNVRYAQNLVLDSCGTTCTSLYVTGASGLCTEWYSSNGDLLEETTKNNSSIIATGVTGLTFAGNASYNGLISVSFSLNQAPKGTEETAVSIYESFAADNMPAAVQAASDSNRPCSFNN